MHDQRDELGPVTAYLRDPQVENVDVNGRDQVRVSYASGERPAGPPVALWRAFISHSARMTPTSSATSRTM